MTPRRVGDVAGLLLASALVLGACSSPAPSPSGGPTPSEGTPAAATPTGPSPEDTAPSPEGTAPVPGSTGSGPAPGGSATPGPSASAPAPEGAPVVTQAGFTAGVGIEVSGYVPTVHDAGTCVLVATHGSDVRRVSRDAAPDATTTACGTLTLAEGELSSGVWQVRLSFTPPGGRALASDSQEVSVP